MTDHDPMLALDPIMTQARDTLRQQPEAVAARITLGECLLKQQNAAAALETLAPLLQRPDFPRLPAEQRFRALWTGAEAALACQRPRVGLQLAQRALRLQPNHLGAALTLGELFARAGAPGQGQRLLEQVLAQDPDNSRALAALGQLLHSGEGQARSLALFERLLTLAPQHPVALILSAAGRLLSAAIDDEATTRARLEAFLEVESAPVYAIKAAYWVPFIGMPPAFERRAWAGIERSIQHTLADQPPLPAPAPIRPLAPGQRLRLGYISPNFGNHGIGHVTQELYAQHDRERFEVFVYPTNERPQDQSSFKQRIVEGAEHYRPLSGQGPAAMAQTIRNDGIDILIDLNGYMGATNILEACALRPAPLQLYWLGHGGALGLPWYDAIIGDAVVTPAAEDAQYREAVVRLPHCFAPACPHPIADHPPSRAEQGLAEGAFVFCAFNNPAKIDRRLFSCWMQILGAVPDSQLWLTRGHNAQVASHLRSAAQAAGIDPARLVFASRLPDKAQHFARHRLADLYLDTFGVNAATSCLDALWSGLPVLSRPGQHFCSRIGASMLTSAGVPELIVANAADYVDTAIALAGDPQRLAMLRERVGNARQQSPLFDIGRFTRGLEAALLEHWQQRAADARPDPAAA